MKHSQEQVEKVTIVVRCRSRKHEVKIEAFNPDPREEGIYVIAAAVLLSGRDI